MKELSAIEIAGKLSEIRVIQRDEREAKQSIENAGKDEKSATRKELDKIKTDNRRRLEEKLEQREIEREYSL